MIEPLTILLWSLILGATAAGLSVIIRSLPFIKRWVQEGRKPWACDVCMPVWTVVPLVLLLFIWRQDIQLLLVVGPAYPCAMWILMRLTDPVGPPPMPELEDSDVG